MAVTLVACASDSVVHDAPRHVEAMGIAPYAFHEECATMVPGDRLDYRFEASQPVDFHLYYRDGIAFVSPISRADVREFAGVFLSRDKRRFCLHWEAGPAGTLVDIRVRLLRQGAAP